MPFSESELPLAALRGFCRRWRVAEFALFGSVLRPDFGPTSDIDVVVEFQPEAPWNLWDLGQMHDELVTIFGRPVDLVEGSALKNPFRKHAILSSKRIIDATN